MIVARRIIWLNAAVVLVTVGLVTLCLGLAEAGRQEQVADAETRRAAVMVAAGIEPEWLPGAPDQLAGFLDRLRAGGAAVDGCEVMVTDTGGHVLGSTGARARGSSPPGAASAVVEAVESGLPQTVDFEREKGTGTYAAAPVLGDQAGAAPVGVVFVERPAGASAGESWRLIAGLGAAALALAALMLTVEAGVLSRWLSAPLERVRVAIEALGWGGYAVRIGPTEAGALGRLSGSVNSLADRLDDVSHRRRALEAAVEGLSTGLVLADARGLVVWTSRRAGDLLGLDPTAARGRPLADLVAAGSSPGEPPGAELGVVLTELWEGERVVVDADGTARWLSLSGFPLVGEDGAPQGHALVVGDASAVRDWRGEQRRLAAALGEANRMRSGLFRLLGGDFGARLGAAAGPDWELREMLALIGELGDVDSTYLRAVVQECWVRECVEDAVQARAVLAATRGASVQVVGHDLEVQADRGGLVRCLSHLVGAGLYVTDGPVRIMIGVVAGEDDTPIARVDVEVMRPSLVASDMEDLITSGIDAGLLERMPGPFALSLYLSARYSSAMHARLDAAGGEEGALVLSLSVPLSPLGALAFIQDEAGAAPGVGLVDPLTGLATVLAFERALAEEVHRATRLRRSFAVVAVDIEDLGRINRAYGVGTGDRVLLEVAEIVKRSLRMHDLVSRAGGGMLMLLYDTPRPKAIVHMEKLRYALGRHIAATPDNQPAGRVSVSLGLAGFPEDGASARRLVEVAQSALRRDKERREEGRGAAGADSRGRAEADARAGVHTRTADNSTGSPGGA